MSISAETVLSKRLKLTCNTGTGPCNN